MCCFVSVWGFEISVLRVLGFTRRTECRSAMQTLLYLYTALLCWAEWGTVKGQGQHTKAVASMAGYMLSYSAGLYWALTGFCGVCCPLLQLVQFWWAPAFKQSFKTSKAPVGVVREGSGANAGLARHAAFLGIWLPLAWGPGLHTKRLAVVCFAGSHRLSGALLSFSGVCSALLC